jgi:hypothetical protein
MRESDTIIQAMLPTFVIFDPIFTTVQTKFRVDESLVNLSWILQTKIWSHKLGVKTVTFYN